MATQRRKRMGVLLPSSAPRQGHRHGPGHARRVRPLSESLRLKREDCGNGLRAVGRSDSTAFTNRLSDLRPTGATSARRAVVVSRCVGSHLARMRSLGVTRPGEPLHGLPDDSWPKTSPTRPRTPKQVMTSRPSSCGQIRSNAFA